MEAAPANPVDARRYDAVEDPDGTWQVIDLMTGLPAASNGRDFIQLRKADAEELSDELNRFERAGNQSPLI